MKNISRILASLSAFMFLSKLTIAQENSFSLATVGGKKIAYKLFNIKNRKHHEPILVFEHGMGGGSFGQLFTFLPANIAAVEYNRNGIGQSEHDSSIVTDNQLMERLHSLLKILDVSPPYLLVGHSIGGPYIRLFTAKYPTEVCGLVFIDPTDFMLNEREDLTAKSRSGSQTSYQQIWKINLQIMSRSKDMSEGARNDAKRALKANTPVYFKEYLESLVTVSISRIRNWLRN